MLDQTYYISVMAFVKLIHEYDPETLNEQEIDQIMKMMTISLRYMLGGFVGHPTTCAIHEGRSCDHENIIQFQL